MYVIISYHGLDDQCVAVRVANMVCVLLTKGDIVHLPSELLGRPLVQRVCIYERSFLCFSEIVVLGPSRLPGEVRSTENSPNLAIRSCLALVVAQLGDSVTDVISEVPFTDEFLDLILEHNVLFDGVADIFVIPVILALVSFRAVPS